MSELIHPTGTFNDAEITDHGFGESANGTPHVWAVFKTSMAEITGYFYLTEKSAAITQERLAIMGVPKSMDWAEVVKGIEDGSLLKGNTVQIVVAADTWEGKTRAKVASVRTNNYIGGPQRSQEAAVNAARFGALWRTVGQKSAAPAAMKPTEGDDIPF